jgi:hypothetical protein
MLQAFSIRHRTGGEPAALTSSSPGISAFAIIHGVLTTACRSLHNEFMEPLYSNSSCNVRPGGNMKFFGAIVLSFAVSLLICQPSFAGECYSDLDCTEGNRCLRKGDDAKGICLEGSQPPGTIMRQTPVSDKPQRDTKGKMCWSSKDCEADLECVMKPGQMYGICR